MPTTKSKKFNKKSYFVYFHIESLLSYKFLIKKHVSYQSTVLLLLTAIKH